MKTKCESPQDVQRIGNEVEAPMKDFLRVFLLMDGLLFDIKKLTQNPDIPMSEGGAAQELCSGLYKCPQCGIRYQAKRTLPVELYCQKCGNDLQPARQQEPLSKKLPAIDNVRTFSKIFEGVRDQIKCALSVTGDSPNSSTPAQRQILVQLFEKLDCSRIVNNYGDLLMKFCSSSPKATPEEKSRMMTQLFLDLLAEGYRRRVDAYPGASDEMIQDAAATILKIAKSKPKGRPAVNRLLAAQIAKRKLRGESWPCLAQIYFPELPKDKGFIRVRTMVRDYKNQVRSKVVVLRRR